MAGQCSAGTLPRDFHMLGALEVTLMAEASAATPPAWDIARSRGLMVGASIAHKRECIALTNVLQVCDPITCVSTIADRVKLARASTGLNQKDFAEKAGVSAGTIGNLEAGARGGNTESLLGIARAAQVRLEWLAEGIGPSGLDEGEQLAAAATNLAERLEAVRQAAGWSSDRLVEVAGTSELEALRLDQAVRIGAASGFSAVWIFRGKGAPKVAAAPDEDTEPEPEYAGRPRAARQVPVIGTAKLGGDGFYEEISPVQGHRDGHIEIATQDPNAYGLRVRGQSMFPAIRDGWYVLVEPNGQPRIGEYVLVKLRDGRKMVKELLQRRPASIEVMSVNGSERMTFDFPDIEAVLAVGAVVSPSKYQPD